MVGVSALVWTLIILGVWDLAAKLFRSMSQPRRAS